MLALRRVGLARALASIPLRIADLVLPPACPGCGGAVSDANALCARCWSAMRLIEPPLCPVYGTPFTYDLGSGIVSAEALADPPPFRRARAAALYDDLTKRLVHQVKYHDRPHLAEFMARAMLRAGRPLLAEGAILVPIPLHRWRLFRRRFNQAALLAGIVARLSDARHDPFILERVKPTRQQVGLTATQRADNVRGAFRVPKAARVRIAGRNAVLIDDVYTSGATAKAATRALLRAGAATVDVLTFARVAR